MELLVCRSIIAASDDSCWPHSITEELRLVDQSGVAQFPCPRTTMTWIDGMLSFYCHRMLLTVYTNGDGLALLKLLAHQLLADIP